MKRFSPMRAMRNIVAFFRRDIFRAFFAHKDYRVRTIAYSGVLLIVLSICGDTYLLACLTKQTKVVMTSYEKAPAHEFIIEVLLLIGMYHGFAVLDYIRPVISQMFSWYWREEMTCFFLARFHLIAHVDKVSQRITDALKAFTMQAPEIFTTIVRAIILSCMMLPMLWELSEFFTIRYPAQGMLVYFVIGYCAVQTLVSLRWGKPLISLQEQSQAMEAGLRDPLVLIQNRRNTVNGKVMQRRTRGIQRHVRGPLRQVNFKVIWGSALLNAWKSFHVQVFAASLGILMILAKLGYVVNDLGTLMQIAGALTAMHGSVAVGSEIMFKCTEAGGSLKRLDQLERSETVFETYASAAE